MSSCATDIFVVDAVFAIWSTIVACTWDMEDSEFTAVVTAAVPRPVTAAIDSSFEMHEVPVDNFVIYYTVSTKFLTVTVIRTFYGGQDAENIVKSE